MTRAKTTTFLALGGALVMCAAAVLLAPYFLTLDRFIPRIEHAASTRLGVPVRIGGLGVSLLPAPHATARDIDIGMGEVKLDRALIYPELLSLFSATKVIRRIEVDKLFLRESLLALLKLPPADPKAPRAVELRHITVRELTPQAGGASLGTWRVDLELGGALGVTEAKLRSSDGRFEASLVPAGKAWDLTIAATNWQSPLGRPVKFESLAAKGKLTETSLDLPDVRASLYGGTLHGTARAEFADRWTVSGRFDAEQVELVPLLRLYSQKRVLGGRLKADGRFTARAADPARLAEALGVAGSFAISNGVLHGMDLAGAVTQAAGVSKAGGETRFDRFTGSYNVAGKNVQLRNLAVTSGVLGARGGVDIIAASRLGGRVEVEVKGSRGLVAVPLAVSGTLQEPSVTPTRGSMAGAAVGTILMPGVGTGVGASVGDWLERKLKK